MMNKQKKIAYVEEMKKIFSSNEAVMIAHYQGLTVNELDKILSIIDNKVIEKNGPLKNKTFMFTGKLNGISRAEAKSLIEKNSGSIISNVSKKLNYLIVGEKPTKRKIDLANELEIKILEQEDWLRMLNK